MATVSNNLNEFWRGLDRFARTTLLAGVLVCLAFAAWLIWWTLQSDNKVLFSQLTESDASAITEQLKRQKVPYELAEQGTAIKVAADKVYDTRLSLMASGVPLSGGIGFEIFDKQSLGATEQSQRVSYQRALQGELARTIGTLDNVKQARVHLVLPESSLFKRDRQEARAAVTLTLKPNAVLAREQIIGIQRLVSSSIAGLDVAKVVIVDQRGVTLSSGDALGVGEGSSEARLNMKREIEEYVTLKVVKLLDSTFGPGQAIVSVDVALNFDEIKRTIQDVVPMRGVATQEGALLRKRQISTGGSGTSSWNEESGEGAKAANSTVELEYEFGKRVEQVIAAPGGITRLSIGVVVPGNISEEKRTRIMDLVRMAAGINNERGDAIVVQPLDQLIAPPTAVVTADEPQTVSDPVASPKPVTISWAERFINKDSVWVVAIAFGLLVLIALGLGWRSKLQTSPASALSDEERLRLLAEVQRALSGQDQLADLKGKR